MKKGIGQTWLSIEALAVYANRIWFTEGDTNGIYFYDLEKKECELFCTIDKEKQNEKRLFRTINIYKNKLYLFPFAAQNAYKVDIETREIEVIEIEEPQKGIYEAYNSSAKFLSSFIYEERIFVVGVTYPAILEYEIETGKIVYHSEWMNEIKMYLKNDEVLFRRGILVKDKIYIPSGRGNVLLVYDLVERKYDINKIGNEEEGFSSICFDGEEFWMAPINNGSIIKWNETSREVDWQCKVPENFHKGNHSWNEIIFWKEHILLLPGKADTVLEVSKKMNKIPELTQSLQGIGYTVSYVDGENLYLFSEKNAVLYIIDSEVHVHEAIRMASLNKESRDLKTIYVVENRVDTLEEYLSFLTEASMAENNGRTGPKSFEDEIWKQVR